VTDAFRKNWVIMVGKLGKTVGIFAEREHTKHQGFTFWPEKIDRYFPRYGAVMSSVTKYWPNSWLLHTMGNTSLIFSGQNVTPQFLMCSISKNIPSVLPNFPFIIIQFFRKASVMTVTTLVPIQHHQIFWVILVRSQNIPVSLAYLISHN